MLMSLDRLRKLGPVAASPHADFHVLTDALSAFICRMGQRQSRCKIALQSIPLPRPCLRTASCNALHGKAHINETKDRTVCENGICKENIGYSNITFSPGACTCVSSNVMAPMGFNRVDKHIQTIEGSRSSFVSTLFPDSICPPVLQPGHRKRYQKSNKGCAQREVGKYIWSAFITRSEVQHGHVHCLAMLRTRLARNPFRMWR